MTDKARAVIDPGATSVVIPGVPAGTTLTVTAYAEDVFGQISDPTSDTIDTPAAQVTLTDPDAGVEILTTNTDPGSGNVGAQPFLYNEWKRLIRNGDFHDPPPDPDSPINNTTNKLPGFSIVDVFLDPVDPDPDTDGYIMWVADATTGSGGRVDFHQLAGAFILISDTNPARSTSTRNNSVVAIASASIDVHTDDHDLTIQVNEYDSSGDPLGFLIAAENVALSTSIEDGVAPGLSGLHAATQTIRMLVYPGYNNVVLSLYEVQVIELGAVIGGADVGDPTNAPWTAIYDNGVLTINADSVVISSLSGYQPLDSDLTALAANTSNGVWARTGSGTGSARTITAGAGGSLSVTNGNGVSGNPTVSRAALTGDATASADDNATTVVSASTTFAFSASATNIGSSGGATTSYVDQAIAGVTLRWADAAGATLHGITAGTTGRIVIIENISTTQTFTIANDSATEGTASRRIHCPGNADFLLGPRSSVMLRYDSTASVWRVIFRGNYTATPPAIGTSGSAGTQGVPEASGDHTHAHEPAHCAHDTVWAAKGDTLLGTANDTAAILTIGSNDTMLMADSSKTTGQKWATAGQGGEVATALGLTTTSTPVFRGIAFPITQTPDADPNTLDDYEEGTFTPALQYASAGGSSWAVTTQTGFYTKIGNRVLFHGIYQGVPTNSAATGNLQMTGFPFTSNSTTNSGTAFACQFQGYTKANFTWVSGNLAANQTTGTYAASGSGQTTTTLAVGDIPTGGTVRIVFNGHYFV